MDERLTDNHKPVHSDITLPPVGDRRFARDTLPLLAAMAVALLVLLYFTTVQAAAGSVASGAAPDGAVQLATGSNDRTAKPTPDPEGTAADDDGRMIFQMRTQQHDHGLERLTHGLREFAVELGALTTRWIDWARTAWAERDIAMPAWRTPSAEELSTSGAKATADLRSRIEHSWTWLKATAGDLLARAGRTTADAATSAQDDLQPDRRQPATRALRRNMPVEPQCAGCDKAGQLSI